LARLEGAFLLLAEHLEPRLLRRALAVLVDALLPHQLAERSEDAHLHRGLELTRDPERSGWLLRGTLDDECGERLHTALTAAMATDPHNPTDTAARVPEDEVADEPPRRRSVTQRRHDGLNLLLGKLLGSTSLGSRGKAPVQIGVTVSLDALHDQPGALPARTSSGATIPTQLVRSWLCDSAITRFVLSLGNRVVEVSHTQRTAKPHERRIKHLETGGICQGAGCSRGDPTGHPLIPHHAEPYSINQVTSLADTVLFCEITHNDIHVGGKTIRLKDGRLLNNTGWVDTA
ncbi:MAG: 13E12 repeat family protein, partial [Actinobacteria bacterium]|nr:13E12 repeat family protein [Actinomycetota bacterium]